MYAARMFITFLVVFVVLLAFLTWGVGVLMLIEVEETWAYVAAAVLFCAGLALLVSCVAAEEESNELRRVVVEYPAAA